MEPHSTFDIPLDTLTQGVHDYHYQLDDEFFAAFESDLVEAGEFDVQLEVERIRNQFNLTVRVQGHASVACDRCLETFALPLDAEDELLVKFDAERAREEETVIYVPFGTERLNVAKIIYDVIGLSLPMSKVHEDAALECDPTMIKYLVPESGEEATEDTTTEITEDSPWRALRGLESNDN